jgi:hypothetical protein
MARFILFAVFGLFSAGQLDYSRKIDWNLPDEVRHRLDKSKLFDYYKLSDEVNPFYLRGDLDGDGKPDYAILVTAKGSDKRFVLISRSGTKNLEILAGRDTSTVFDPEHLVSFKENFNWMDAWQITERQELDTNELNERTPSPMKGEGVIAERTEAATVLIYWTGKRYHWYQVAD